jgi:hypothetical protein
MGVRARQILDLITANRGFIPVRIRVLAGVLAVMAGALPERGGNHAPPR